MDIGFGIFPSEVVVPFGEALPVFILIRGIRKLLLKRIVPANDLGGQIGRLTRHWPAVLGLYLFVSNAPRLPSLFRYTDLVLDLYLYFTATLAVIRISVWLLRRFLDEMEIAAPVSQAVSTGIYTVFSLL